MADKPPAFTVTDRRKFTSEGDIREGYAPAEETVPPIPTPAPAETNASGDEDVVDAIYTPPAQVPGGQTAPAPSGGRVVTMPSPAAPPPAPPPPQLPTDDMQETAEDASAEGDMLPEPTAAETAEQHTAYRESSRQLDEMIRQQNPGMKAAGPVTIEHVIQSIYLSAVVAMGAAAEPGQKPRIDIIGARQSIEMLSVLQDKTRGNLNDKEQRLLQNMLFELRMMFLEITNAIAQQALNPPPIGKR